MCDERVEMCDELAFLCDERYFALFKIKYKMKENCIRLEYKSVAKIIGRIAQNNSSIYPEFMLKYAF